MPRPIFPDREPVGQGGKPLFGKFQIQEGSPIKVDSVALATEAVVFTPPNTRQQNVYQVWFQFSETAGSQGLVTVGIDAGAGGGLVAAEQILTLFDVPALWTTEWFGPYIMDGTDTLRAKETGAGTVTMHFRIQEMT